jgi:hypothetical protein
MTVILEGRALVDWLNTDPNTTVVVYLPNGEVEFDCFAERQADGLFLLFIDDRKGQNAAVVGPFDAGRVLDFYGKIRERIVFSAS